MANKLAAADQLSEALAIADGRFAWSVVHGARWKCGLFVQVSYVRVNSTRNCDNGVPAAERRVRAAVYVVSPRLFLETTKTKFSKEVFLWFQTTAPTISRARATFGDFERLASRKRRKQCRVIKSQMNSLTPHFSKTLRA